MTKFIERLKSFFKTSGETDMYATIVNAAEGFNLVNRGTGTVIQTYARARDARRGAARRGFVIA